MTDHDRWFNSTGIIHHNITPTYVLLSNLAVPKLTSKFNLTSVSRVTPTQTLDPRWENGPLQRGTAATRFPDLVDLEDEDVEHIWPDEYDTKPYTFRPPSGQERGPFNSGPGRGKRGFKTMEVVMTQPFSQAPEGALSAAELSVVFGDGQKLLIRAQPDNITIIEVKMTDSRIVPIIVQGASTPEMEEQKSWMQKVFGMFGF